MEKYLARGREHWRGMTRAARNKMLIGLFVALGVWVAFGWLIKGLFVVFSGLFGIIATVAVVVLALGLSAFVFLLAVAWLTGIIANRLSY